MWDIINKTPFKADYLFTQDGKTRDLIFMVAVKATFDISVEDRNPTIAEEQTELNTADEFRGDPLYTSLFNINDFMMYKPKVDVLLNATAYAPEEKPVRELTVGFVLGRQKKQLNVMGNRYYKRIMGVLTRTMPSLFIKKEITYENAFGGWQESKDKNKPLYETRNPAGKGYVKNRWSLADIDLPNIEYPGFPTRKTAKKNQVAGFGPIAAHWSPRSEYSGTIVQEQQPEDTPVRPPDFNPLYYQYAPIDQQLDEINGDEPVVLQNMHPEHPEIHFFLPSVSIEFETFVDNKTIHQPAKLHTVLIEPDKLKLQMVWQGNLACPNRGKTLEYTNVTHQMKMY